MIGPDLCSCLLQLPVYLIDGALVQGLERGLQKSARAMLSAWSKYQLMSRKSSGGKTCRMLALPAGGDNTLPSGWGRG